MTTKNITKIITTYNLAKNSYTDLLVSFGVECIYFYGIFPPFNFNSQYLSKVNSRRIRSMFEPLNEDLYEPACLYGLANSKKAHIDLELPAYINSLKKIEADSENSLTRKRIKELIKIFENRNEFHITVLNLKAHDLRTTPDKFMEFYKYLTGEKSFIEYKLSIHKIGFLSTVDKINKHLTTVERRADEFIREAKKESKSLGASFFLSKVVGHIILDITHISLFLNILNEIKKHYPMEKAASNFCPLFVNLKDYQYRASINALDSIQFRFHCS